MSKESRKAGNDLEFGPSAATGGIGLMQTHCPRCEEWPGRCRCPDYESTTATTSGAANYSGTYYAASCVPAFLSDRLPSEPCVVMSETEARRLVTAIDNARPSDVIGIIQRQPWFREVRRGIRATRHLKCGDYIKLSERQKQIPTE